MSNQEQSVIDVFNKFMAKQAQNRGQLFGYVPLNGQDRHVLADYLLTNESMFTLVEFKYSQAELQSEARKARSLSLCRFLEGDAGMRALHDRCHYAAWMQTPELRAQLNIYRHQICNCEVFGPTCGLKSTSPLFTNLVDAGEFARSFFEEPSTRTLTIDEFDVYVKWLMEKVGGNATSTLELLVQNEDSANCDFIRFASVRALHNWFQDRKPGQKHIPAPSSGPGW